MPNARCSSRRPFVRRPRAWALVMVGALIVAPPRVGAQQGDSLALRRAVEATAPRSVVRVQLRDESRYSGALVGTRAGGLDLAGDDAALFVPYSDVTRFWQRGRATKWGLIAGGLIGAGFGGLLALVPCDGSQPCDDNNTKIVLTTTGLGAAGGGILGAAIPRWRLRWEITARNTGSARVVPTTVPARSARAREVGDLTLQLAGGYVRLKSDPSADRDIEDEGAVGGVLATLTFRKGRFGLGPEVIYMTGASRVTAASGLIRVDLVRQEAAVAPYALLGLGGYAWKEAECCYLTLPVGVGLSLGANRRWRAEARWHQLVHWSAPPSSGITISAGTRLSW